MSEFAWKDAKAVQIRNRRKLDVSCLPLVDDGDNYPYYLSHWYVFLADKEHV